MKTIIESCNALELEERKINRPKFQELQKEQVLGDIRLEKMYQLQRTIREFQTANDPLTLKQMFAFQNAADEDYEQESRAVAKEYMSVALNPSREVAKIEMKAKRLR